MKRYYPRYAGLLAGLSLSFSALSAGAQDYSAQPEPASPKPALCASFTDPVFGANVTRLTDHVQMGLPGVANEYAKAQPWNADGSLFLVRAINSRFFLLDETCEPLTELSLGLGREPRWSPSDPNLLRFIDGNELKELRVDTGAITTLKVFAEYQSISTRDEGNWSADFDAIALFGMSGNAPKEAFVYRVSTGSVSPKLSLQGTPAGADWISISPSGQQVLIMFGENDRWQEQGRSGRQLGYGLDVFDANMGNRRRVQDHVHHGDICLTPDGQEAFVGSASNAFGAAAHDIRATRLSDALPLSGDETQGATGVFTPLLTLDWSLGTHVSCRNLGQPGWAYVSTYDGGPPASVPFSDELFAIKLDGSGEVRRLAHLHNVRGAYFEEPHAVVSPDGRAALFTSNWGESVGSEQVDVYWLRLATSGLAEAPATPPETSAALELPGASPAGCAVGQEAGGGLGVALLLALVLMLRRLTLAHPPEGC
jgi:hypothetical protein